MNDFYLLFYTFADAVAWILALVFVVSVLHRRGHKKISNSCLMGAIFSLAIVFSMSDPIVLPKNSGIYDMRYLLIGVATGLFGPLVGGLAVASTLSYRLWIGGPGVSSAIVGSLVVFVMCWAYHRYVAERDLPTVRKSVILGALISTQLSALLVVPQDKFMGLLIDLGPYMVVSSFLGALMLNHLLSGELSFLSRTERLKIEANTDHLTGLANRRGLELLFPKFQSAARGSRGQALICFDVDRFKAMNDRFGHAAGDDVLRHIVNLVASRLRKDDSFARLGGDEFCIVLPDIQEDEAARIAERCRTIVEDGGLNVGADVIYPSISVGGIWLQKPATIDQMLQEADEALYAAKARGRNTVVFRAARALEQIDLFPDGQTAPA